MNIRILAIAFLASSWLFAGEHGSSDFIPRTVNFLIFATILYYLVAEPIKNFFKNRSASIAQKLEEVQIKLKRAKEDKEKAQAELEKAKELAREILETTKKEIEIVTKELKKQAQQELQVLEQTFEENLELERRKRVREITKEVLEELFEDQNVSLDKEKFINLIIKKVA